MTDPAAVTDPREALAISREGLAAQHRLTPAVHRVVADLESLRRQNHIADRLENLLGQRR